MEQVQIDALTERRLRWLRSADQEFESLGAPVVNLRAAEVYWEAAWEQLSELVLDEYGDELPEADLLLYITAYDIALLALALAAEKRDDRWTGVVMERFLERYHSRLNSLRRRQTLPNVRLSLRGWESDADPGL
jgi:hypothetical protein